MSFFQSTLALVCICLTVTTASPHSRTRSLNNIPLRQHQCKGDAVRQTLHTASRHYGHSRFAIAPETLDAGFWYGSFDVGETKNLSLLIDTGSDDVAVNPGLYKPTSQSHNLNETGSLGYGTTEADGCGFAKIKYSTYTDVVSFAGLVAHNQTLANVISTPPPNNATITKFPHQGLVGFGGTKANETQLGGVPFFQTLCNQGFVDECRFGLALGTSGRGQQILGGVDGGLFEGHLVSAPWVHGEPEVIQGGLIIDGVNGTVVRGNQTFIFDSGTANIVGGAGNVRTLFKQLGVQAVELSLPGCSSVVFGYYPCDAPPKVGLSFSSNSEAFMIEPSAFALAHNGGNNCTATITGLELPGIGSEWIIGQSWFQGKYVDFQQAKGRIGVATLRDKTCGGSWTSA